MAANVEFTTIVNDSLLKNLHRPAYIAFAEASTEQGQTGTQKNASILFQHRTGENLSKFLFSMLGKIAFHHPVIIFRLRFQYV